MYRHEQAPAHRFGLVECRRLDWDVFFDVQMYLELSRGSEILVWD